MKLFTNEVSSMATLAFTYPGNSGSIRFSNTPATRLADNLSNNILMTEEPVLRKTAVSIRKPCEIRHITASITASRTGMPSVEITATTEYTFAKTEVISTKADSPGSPNKLKKGFNHPETMCRIPVKFRRNTINVTGTVILISHHAVLRALGMADNTQVLRRVMMVAFKWFNWNL